MEETEAVSETTAAVTPIDFVVDRYVVTCCVAMTEGGQKVNEFSFSTPPLFNKAGGTMLEQVGAQAVQHARQQWEQQNAH